LPPEPDDIPVYIQYEDEAIQPQVAPEADELDYEGYNKYISAKVWLPNPDGNA
jgi:hypothetical protein